MNDATVVFQRSDLVVSTDRRRIDLAAALALLHPDFWAAGMARQVLPRAVENSLLTRHAESLYAGLGFTAGPGTLIYMEHRSR